ncbi:hypothetical protein L3Q82_021631 [Scortum barcoo]|uniref:Uncharacterized protein n=1 Tax=Scortum barcoo TaxID=214431 RepID=A0ACB8X576_9TELE|nr:hypothetical protein L3Q82_021631 [Scortum barcoo]
MMPLPQLWAASFFIIVFLGLDSEFVYLEGLVMSLYMYPSFFFTGHRRKLLLFVICAVSSLTGLCMITEEGLYVFQLFDYYACNGIPLMIFAILESVCMGWVYGADCYYNNAEDMIGYFPVSYMKYCWMFITPCVSAVEHIALLFGLIHPYALGLFLAFSSVVVAPLWFLYSLAVTPGTLRQVLRISHIPHTLGYLACFISQ